MGTSVSPCLEVHGESERARGGVRVVLGQAALHVVEAQFEIETKI
jgi:hypothetical protein